jgi:DNA-binding CsgD family transcriptional regulator
MNDSEISRAYDEAKSSGQSITDLAVRLKMTRNQLYRVVQRVEEGNRARAQICINMGRLDCLWTWMYKSKFEALPKDRKPSTIVKLRAIIKGMEKDGFPVKRIAKILGKDRSTVLHHLGK